MKVENGGPHDYYDERDDGAVHAYIRVEPGKKGHKARGYVQGRGRGDECMQVVDDLMSEAIEDLGGPIEHVFQATNDGAARLAERTPGYEPAGTNKKGEKLYRKEYRK